MYFDRKCKITYIAHGATIYSEEGRFSDNNDYPQLNDTGIDEIEKICKFLKIRRIKNDKIFTSPSVRTIQSAKIISKMYKQDFEVINDLLPRKCGSFNGMTFNQLEEKHPEELFKLINQTDIPTPSDAESVTDFITRISATVDNIIEENYGTRLIVVTHPDVIKAVICKALKMPHSSMQHIYIKTGSATQISYYKDWESLVYSDYVPV